MTRKSFTAQDQEEMQKVTEYLLDKMQKEGKTLKEAAGLSDHMLEEIYCLAYSYYNQGKYKEAQALFFLLASIASNSFKYVFGLAASYHQLKEFDNALAVFFKALHLNPENPTCTYYMADCFIKLDEVARAISFLDITIEICQDKKEFQILKERTQLIKKSLETKV